MTERHTGDILYERHENVAVVTFNRPRVLNAFRDSTFTELAELLERVAIDDAIRVLVMTGTGRAFSSGEDLKELGKQQIGPGMPLGAMEDQVGTLQEITRRIVHSPKTVIAAVNGIAVGFGAELAIACDVRVAADAAQFMFTEAARSLMPTNGVLYLLPRLVGWGRAKQWLIASEPITAADALQAGLVTRVVPHDAVLDAALALARTIAANAPISVRLIREALRRTYDFDLEGMMQLEVEGLMETMASEDVVEGIGAFAEKRPPNYKGR